MPAQPSTTQVPLPRIAPPATMIALPGRPADDPDAWRHAASAGADTVAVVGPPGAAAGAWTDLARAIDRAVRAARRAGLNVVVLNPGVPVDPVYRRLDATICTFEGTWAEYLAGHGRPGGAGGLADGCRPGDGHLVYAVPTADLAAARALLAARRAGLVLVTDRPAPALAAGVAAAGNAGTSTTSGS